MHPLPRLNDALFFLMLWKAPWRWLLSITTPPFLKKPRAGATSLSSALPCSTNGTQLLSDDTALGSLQVLSGLKG